MMSSINMIHKLHHYIRRCVHKNHFPRSTTKKDVDRSDGCTHHLFTVLPCTGSFPSISHRERSRGKREQKAIMQHFLYSYFFLSRGNTTKQVASKRVYQQWAKSSGKITPAYLQVTVHYIFTHTSSVNIDTTHSSSVHNLSLFSFARKDAKERAPVYFMNEAYRSKKHTYTWHIYFFERIRKTARSSPCLTTPEGRRRKNCIESVSLEFDMPQRHTFARWRNKIAKGKEEFF